jgi:hypothetical protein
MRIDVRFAALKSDLCVHAFALDPLELQNGSLVPVSASCPLDFAFVSGLLLE